MRYYRFAEAGFVGAAPPLGRFLVPRFYQILLPRVEKLLIGLLMRIHPLEHLKLRECTIYKEHTSTACSRLTGLDPGSRCGVHCMFTWQIQRGINLSIEWGN